MFFSNTKKSDVGKFKLKKKAVNPLSFIFIGHVLVIIMSWVIKKAMWPACEF